VGPNVSVGLEPLFEYSSSTTILGTAIDSKTTTLGLGLRIGTNVPLGPTVSWWLRGALGFWTQDVQKSAAQGYSVSYGGTSVPLGPNTEFRETAMWIGVSAPLLVHPASHFFVGFGPNGFTDVSHSIGQATNRRTFFGFSTIVGGWF
jgi:hypothetical protein